MFNNNFLRRAILASVLAFSLLFSSVAFAATPPFGMIYSDLDNVQNNRWYFELLPGESATDSFIAINGDPVRWIILRFDTSDSGYSDAHEWVSFNLPTARLEPSERVEVAFTVDVPEDAAPSSENAVGYDDATLLTILDEYQDDSGGGVSVSAALGRRLRLLILESLIPECPEFQEYNAETEQCELVIPQCEDGEFFNQETWQCEEVEPAQCSGNEQYSEYFGHCIGLTKVQCFADGGVWTDDTCTFPEIEEYEYEVLGSDRAESAQCDGLSEGQCYAFLKVQCRLEAGVWNPALGCTFPNRIGTSYSNPSSNLSLPSTQVLFAAPAVQECSVGEVWVENGNYEGCVNEAKWTCYEDGGQWNGVQCDQENVSVSVRVR